MAKLRRDQDDDSLLLSVVAPALNEEEVIEEFYDRVCAVLEKLSFTAEIVLVNDGSTDRTAEILERLRQADPRVAVLELTRSFGKEAALTAGIDHAHGDAVVVIDSDLQDPPELIPELIEHWQDGYDVVYAQRKSRRGESLTKRASAHMFYRLLRRTSPVAIPPDTGDFRLMSRRAVDSLLRLRERHRFMKGLFAWIGYPQKSVPFERDARRAGTTKWNYWRLWNYALTGLTSFTTAPLKFATYLGLVVALGAFVYAGIIVYRTLAFGNPVAGYPSLITVVLFLGGAQLTFTGVLGEYLARMYDESKHRPIYLVKNYDPAPTVGDAAAPRQIDDQHT